MKIQTQFSCGDMAWVFFDNGPRQLTIGQVRVKGLLNGRIAYNGSMCGPCTWGEDDAADPANWN